MTKIIEHVAKSLFALTFITKVRGKMLEALWDDLPAKTEWIGMSPREVVGKDKFLKRARAAVEAMRGRGGELHPWADHLDAFVAAFVFHNEHHGVRESCLAGINAMIDEALVIPRSKDISRGLHIFMDGNMWCAVGPHFRNLQEDRAGFGETPEKAYEAWWEANKEVQSVKKVFYFRPEFERFTIHR